MDAKQLLRTGVCAARAARDAADRDRLGARLASHAAALLALGRGPEVVTIAAYAGVGDEPPTRALLDALRGAGARVLLPVVADDGAAGGTLDWAAYDGWDALERARWGLLHPRGPRLGTPAVAQADVVLVPALAVDRDGRRLGRGVGFYDRALHAVSRERRVAVVYAEEVLPEVPVEPHDEPVAWALTPDGLLRCDAGR